MRCPIKYKQVIGYVKMHYGYSIQTCVISKVLRELGYEVRTAWNSGTGKKSKEPNVRDRKSIKEAINELSN